MGSSPLVSIAYPTFNRIQFLYPILNQLTAKDFFKNYEFVICDNGSTDETSVKIANLASEFKNISLIRQPRNIGFPGNLISCISNCSADYVLIASDEDTVNVELLPTIEKYLSEHRPDLVSTVHKTAKGLCRKSGSIHYKGDLSYYFTYISGLIFRKAAVLKYMPYIDEVRSNPYFVTYPQRVLAALIHSGGGTVITLNEVLTEHIYQDVFDRGEFKFWTPESRIDQIRGLYAFRQLTPFSDGKPLERWNGWISEERRTVFGLIKNAIYAEPERDFFQDYMRGVKVDFIKMLPGFRILIAMKKFLRSFWRG